MDIWKVVWEYIKWFLKWKMMSIWIWCVGILKDLFDIFKKKKYWIFRYSYINNPQDKNAICRLGFFTKNRFQTRSGTTTAKGEGWSWLCCKYEYLWTKHLWKLIFIDYYPSGVEQPLDYKMISKAVSLPIEILSIFI